MLSREEFEKTAIRMMDSLRVNNEGQFNCSSVYCDSCPLFKEEGCLGNKKIANLYEIIDVVEQWGKEHPIVTNADKFEEVFGTRPIMINADDSYVCPERVGFLVKCSVNGSCCDCKEKFWGAEYKAPTKSEVK